MIPIVPFLEVFAVVNPKSLKNCLYFFFTKSDIDEIGIVFEIVEVREKACHRKFIDPCEDRHTWDIFEIAIEFILKISKQFFAKHLFFTFFETIIDRFIVFINEQENIFLFGIFFYK